MDGFAERLRGVEVAASSAMAARARELAREGAAVIDLSAGEPDFDTPPHVVAAAHRAALAGDTHYPPLDGTRALKDAVRRKFLRENGLDYAPDEVMVANGAKQAIFNALMATLDPGDEVVVPTPTWISYGDMIRLAGGTVVAVPCLAAGGFRLSPAALAAAITPRTRWVILNFPGNPSGVTATEAELRALAEVLLPHPRVRVLSDDMYEHVLLSDRPFRTLAAVEPRLRARVLTVNGVSKTYAMTGWRVGFCGGDRALIQAMVAVQGQATSGVCTVAQAAAVAALDGPQDLLRERLAIYRERLAMARAILDAAPGLSCPTPEGGFFALPDMTGCLGKVSPSGRRITDDGAFVSALLEEVRVAVVPGAAYGAPGHVRVSCGTETRLLVEGCERIRAFCASLGPCPAPPPSSPGP